MSDHAPVLVFDVNETLSDLRPMAGRFEDLELPGPLARTWFAATLRDGMARTLAGSAAPFRDVARDVLLDLFVGQPPSGRAPDAAAEHVLAGFGELPVHPDVVPGVRALRAAGLRLVTLSNGAASVAEGLLTRAGVREEFEAVLTVEDVGVWKPHPRAYAHASEALAVSASELVLVAVHPWDLHGARAAGLRTAWVRREARPWPSVFDAPDHTVTEVGELARALV